MTKIDIYSGFLGAGKTTLIKKLISEAYQGQKLVLIENEFGEIGIDGGFLQDAGVEITEMNSGCICCSLVGDFGRALTQVIDQYHPDRIVIEPSGVGKLSDVVAAVNKVTNDEVTLGYTVAVVDAGKVKLYMKNFGEFYNNQVETASTIILSRTDSVPQAKLDLAVEMLRQHNEAATVVTTPWTQLSGQQLIDAMEGKSTLAAELAQLESERTHEHHCGCGHHHHHEEEHHCCHGHHGEEHEHHHHEEGKCGCGHHHHEEEHHCCHGHHGEEHEHHHHEEGECVCGHHHHEEEHHCCHGHHDEEHEHHHHEEGKCGCGHHHHEEEHHCCHGHHGEEHEHHHHEEGKCGCGHHHHEEEHHCCHGHHDEEHEHHHHHEHGECSCGHHHGEHDHHADEVFTSWGVETTKKFEIEQIRAALQQLDTGAYGMVLRAKGIIPATDGSWIHFDYVPEEINVRTGSAAINGKLCVIGAELNEAGVAALFGV